MTIREKLEKELFNNGLFEDQATAIIDKYAESELGKPMANRMNEDAEGYPDSVLTATWMAVKKIATDWIDENCPQHWARPMFAE